MVVNSSDRRSAAARAVCLLLMLSNICVVYGESWKNYPLILEGNPHLTFPDVEGAQYQYMGDSWFFTAQVTGQDTGKKYQIVTIFNRNYITAVTLNLYQVCDNGFRNVFISPGAGTYAKLLAGLYF